MADKSLIEWTDATWNPITGCSVVSPGCKHCYAMKLAGTRLRHHPTRAGLTQETKAGPVWTGDVRFNAKQLLEPLRWSRPRKIFVCAHGDLFAEGVPDEWIDMVFAVMALCPQHVFQVLTKRPERMRAYLSGDLEASNDDEHQPHQRILAEAENLTRFAKRGDMRLQDLCEQSDPCLPLPNVWLGVSAEDQQRADERIPPLLATPATRRFVSLEPLLGPIDLEPWLAWPDRALVGDKDWGCQSCDFEPGGSCSACPNGSAVFSENVGPDDEDGVPQWVHADRVTLDWVIVGGESGAGARPMHPDWARSLRDQCTAAGVPFFFKQWGAWIDADHWLDHLERNGEFVLVDGRPFQPPQPMKYSHAELLARATGREFEHQSDGTTMILAGKKAAGRLLDGVQHAGMPA